MTGGALWQRYLRWLDQPSSAQALAVFRAGWALAMFIATAHEWARYDLYSTRYYHVPCLPWITAPSATAFYALLRIAAIGCVLAFFGVLARLSIAAVVVIHAYLFATDLLLFRNHIYLGLLLGVLLFAAPSAQAWSLMSMLRRPAAGPRRGSHVAAQLIKAQVTIVYIWSVLNKLRPSFLDGWTLAQELPYALQQSVLAPWLYDRTGRLLPPISAFLHAPTSMMLTSVAVVLAESFLAIGLGNRRLHRTAVCVGLVLHGSILLLMNVATFSLLMVASYPLFGARAVCRITAD